MISANQSDGTEQKNLSPVLDPQKLTTCLRRDTGFNSSKVVKF